MIKPINKEQYHKFWKSYIGSSNQSWAWGDFKSNFGWEVERLGIFDNNELISVISIFKRTFPFSLLTSLFGFNKFAYIPRGFAVKDVRFFDLVLKSLDKYYRNKKEAFILIDPENNLLVNNWNEEFKKALESAGFKNSGVTIQANQTDVIEIDKDEDELMDQIRPKWRRNIKKSERHGVKIKEESGDSAVDKFYSVILKVQKNTDFKAHSKEYYKKMWEILKKDELIKIFTANYRGKIIATYLVLSNSVTGYEIYGGATSKGRDLEASYLLKWEIIKRLADSGKQFYDQWGVSPKGEKDHPLRGITYFKSGFGGSYVQFLPQYVKVYNKIGYFLYKFKT